jgi:hypothetical protein
MGVCHSEIRGSVRIQRNSCGNGEPPGVSGPSREAGRDWNVLPLHVHLFLEFIEFKRSRHKSPSISII